MSLHCSEEKPEVPERSDLPKWAWALTPGMVVSPEKGVSQGSQAVGF